MPQPIDTILEFREITKSFFGVKALRGVSFDLRAGEVHAVVGENGAGKSTLIKVIAGAHRPDSGEMVVQGRTVTGLEPAEARRLGIACIYQQPALFPDLTVAENIALRLAPERGLRRIDWSARRGQAAALLGRIGADLSPDREVRRLSMPEQQLVEIACALGTGARIVIMDEPTASLTQKEQHLLFSIVRKLCALGAGVIYISHRLDEVLTLADRISVLRDGAHLGTFAAGEIDEPRLIRLMVGREVEPLGPPKGATAGEAMLQARGLGCRASGVHGVDLSVHAGEVVGLAGLVGSGRTELARILFGLTPADAGEILLRGRPVRLGSPSEAIAAGVAYVPEDRRREGVVLEMSVAANITLAIVDRIFPRGFLNRAAEDRVAREYIGRLDIKTRAPDEAVGNLSGGNQQKVSLARWLATEPRLLILDEPTQGVDVGTKREVHALVRGLARSGVAVLLISSDLPEVLGMCDRIGVMRGGTLAGLFPGTADAHAIMTAAMGGPGANAA